MNSDYLKDIDEKYFEDLILVSDKVDKLIYDDPMFSIQCSRQVLEACIEKICRFNEIFFESKDIFKSLELFKKEKTVSIDFIDLAHKIRSGGNDKSHFDINNFKDENYDDLLNKAKTFALYKHNLIGETAKSTYGITSYPDFVLPSDNKKKKIEESEVGFEGINISQTSIDKIKNDECSIFDNDFSHIVSTNEDLDCVYIPCGCSIQEKGFFIYNIKKQNRCENKYASFYAVLYNIFQQRLLVKTKCYDSETNIILNSSNIYRLQIIILLLIKNNYIKKENFLDLEYDGNIKELEYALNSINLKIEKIAKLVNINIPHISIVRVNPIKISLRQKADVWIKNSNEYISLDRDIWCENNIIFNIDLNDNEHKAILLELLNENFGDKYTEFKNGQLEVISNILNDSKHKICIMPTGAGKSLIFYFIALLRSSPTFVVAPTEILIEDQIRNLKENHNIDNVTYLNNKIDFKSFVPHNKLIYLTPTTFLQRDLINRMIELNYQELIGNVVLDEVHCISNWSHDFRPEYLMLSHNLKSFVDKTGYLCFTATANYTVMKDIIGQLGVLKENILVPKGLVTKNLEFEFVKCKNYDEILKKSAECYEKIIKEKRTLCFVKKGEIYNFYRSLSEEAKYETDGYSNNISYMEFAKGNLNGLITEGDMGVGINLPNVSATIHIGMPISQSQFIQEAGRCSRGDNVGKSFVFFQDKNFTNNLILLKRNTKIKDIISLKSEYKCDIYNTYKILFNDMSDINDFSNKLYKIVNIIKKINCPQEISFSISNHNEIQAIMRCLYFTYRLGIIDGWYLLPNNKNIFRVYIDPGVIEKNISFVKNNIKNYFYRIGSFKKTVKLITDAQTIEEIIEIYIEWFYEHFLYHHREQLLNMLDFLHHNEFEDNYKIQCMQEDYFSLSVIKIEKVQEQIRSISFNNILEYTLKNTNEKELKILSKSLENEYSIKYDYMIFYYNLLKNQKSDFFRLNRIIENSSNFEKNIILSDFKKIYKQLSVKLKIKCFLEFLKHYSLIQLLIKNKR